MIREDKGFPSKYDGICVVCKAYYHADDRIATAPVPYYVHRPNGTVLRFGHLRCVLNAREHPAAVYFGGAA